MRIYAVPSHHRISAKPLEQLGIELVPAMLSHGIWFPVGGSGAFVSGKPGVPDTIKKELRFERSKLETEYQEAFAALYEIGGNHAHSPHAVVAMMWCPMLWRLVCVKRTWLALYQGNRKLCAFSHRDEAQTDPTYSFVHALPAIPIGKVGWSLTFEKALKEAAA